MAPGKKPNICIITRCNFPCICVYIPASKMLASSCAMTNPLKSVHAATETEMMPQALLNSLAFLLQKSIIC